MDYTNLQKHEFNFFPESGKEDRKNLFNSMKQSGFIESFPVMIFEGKVLDGWNRYITAKTVGVTPTFREFYGDREAALNYSICTNLNRRHLTPSQVAAIAVKSDKLWEIEKQKAKERLSTNKKSKDNETDEPKIKGNAADRIGDKFGVSGASVTKAKVIKEKDPELYEKVLEGEVSVSKASKEIKEKEKNVDAATEQEKPKKTIPVKKSFIPEVAKFSKWKINTGEEKQEWQPGDESELLKFAHEQLKQLNQALSRCAGKHQSKAMNQFIKKDFMEIIKKVYSWSELRMPCDKCQNGKVKANGHEIDCEYCGGLGKIGL